MREILFRGKSIDSGAWVYGDLLRYAETAQIWYETDDGKWNCLVDPATVGQYTGMTDAHRKKIFEGDIVKFFGMRGEIVQECGAFGIAVSESIDYDLLESKIPFDNSSYFCFNDNYISLWEMFWNFEQDDNPLFEVEVIGNCWEGWSKIDSSRTETD